MFCIIIIILCDTHDFTITFTQREKADEITAKDVEIAVKDAEIASKKKQLTSYKDLTSAQELQLTSYKNLISAQETQLQRVHSRMQASEVTHFTYTACIIGASLSEPPLYIVSTGTAAELYML